MAIIFDLFMLWIVTIFCPEQKVQESNKCQGDDGFFLIDHFDRTHQDKSYDKTKTDLEFHDVPDRNEFFGGDEF